VVLKNRISVNGQLVKQGFAVATEPGPAATGRRKRSGGG